MKHTKFWAGLMAAVMLLLSVPVAQAATSDEIREDIRILEAQNAENQEMIDQLEQEMDANWGSIEEMIAYKSSIDQQIFLLYSEIDTINDLITNHGLLIVETQRQLDEAEAELAAMNEKYLSRIRAMEEEGKLSYWEILFKARSFTDLMDRLNMIREIAAADQRMLENLEKAADEVAAVKEQLVADKAKLEESRAELDVAKEELEVKRAESDAVLQALNQDHRAMEELHAQYDEAKRELAAQIAQAEKEYNEARAREEEERRRQEEEERRQQELNKPGNGGETDPEPNEPEEPATPPPSSDNGWRWPCAYVMISSPYGNRSGGWHNGVDFANSRGTPIYASRSGTVTTARSLNYSYGKYIVINHGDGFSSLYAHMDYYVVNQGDYVQQGQLIGYMGSSGNSTGNHLHFTIFLNGSDVNPMNYLN